MYSTRHMPGCLYIGNHPELIDRLGAGRLVVAWPSATVSEQQELIRQDLHLFRIIVALYSSLLAQNTTKAPENCHEGQQPPLVPNDGFCPPQIRFGLLQRRAKTR